MELINVVNENQALKDEINDSYKKFGSSSDENKRMLNKYFNCIKKNMILMFRQYVCLSREEKGWGWGKYVSLIFIFYYIYDLLLGWKNQRMKTRIREKLQYLQKLKLRD